MFKDGAYSRKVNNWFHLLRQKEDIYLQKIIIWATQVKRSDSFDFFRKLIILEYFKTHQKK